MLWVQQAESVPRVSALALPGHAGNPGTGLQSVSEYADWVADRLAESEPLILAGHSMGGAIALDLALRSPHPGWLGGLILVGTGARLRVHPDIFAALDRSLDEAIDLVSTWSSGPRPVDYAVATLSGDMRTAGVETVRGDYRAADGFDVMGELAEIDLPTLVIVGAEDRLTPPKYAEYLCTHIRQCSLVVVPGAGHLVMLERPGQVSDAMSQFRDRVESSQGRIGVTLTQ
jgi:pimeloyl-ACP methyl ester carboxylesterase